MLIYNEEFIRLDEIFYHTHTDVNPKPIHVS